MSGATGFVPPPYPFDRLAALADLAARHEGGIVDLSVGTPGDPPPPAVVAALSTSCAERGYPAGTGTARLRAAARDWIGRRFAVPLDPAQLALCIGTKEFVAGIPHWLRLRRPELDTVLYPTIAYPTYAMGAQLAGCRAVPVPLAADGSLALAGIDPGDAERALCLWVNSPSNPTGALDDLDAAAAWGRANNIPVLSDECYAEFTWDGRPRTILDSGVDGVLAVHSISKRSNCAGLRAGFYAGDGELVHYLSELRRHAGFMVPGPIQHAAAIALEDDEHVEVQRQRYRARIERAQAIFAGIGVKAATPAGGFYLWFEVPDEPDATMVGEWAFVAHLAEAAGTLVSPGEFYGPGGAGHVRVALVQPDERIALVAHRLGVGA